jgi:hypothetical protein
VTGPPDEEITARLAEALNDQGHLRCEEFDVNDPDPACPDCGDIFRLAAALLPVVRRIADLRAAESHDKQSGDGLPAEWQDGPPRYTPHPEGFGIVAHWSSVHEGVNIELDVPDGLRVTVHYNDWLAVDSVAGQDPAVSTS